MSPAHVASKVVFRCVLLQDAYGAVVYEKVEYQNGTLWVHLIASKTEVAPLQLISICHLELMGAVLSNKLLYVLTISKDAITFWTDM